MGKVLWVVLLLLSAGPAVAADMPLVGSWLDGSRYYLYEFKPDNALHFSGVKTVTRSNPNIVPFTGGRGWNRTYTEKRRTDFDGAWEAGPKICGAGEGDLRLYVDSTECCLQTRMLGERLILKVVEVSGESDACVNRALAPYTEG